MARWLQLCAIMKSRRLHWLAGLVAVPAAVSLAVVGCADEDEGIDGFISDDPNRAALDDGYDEGGTSTATGEGGMGTGGAGGGAQGGETDPERLIEEADIIKVDGNRLYALSDYSGLSIIDVSVPDQLTLLGRKPLPGLPFEMYLRDGVIYAMFSSWGHYVETEWGYDWVQSSHLEALNVDDPQRITSLGAFDMPGSLADSRMVGDILYVVSFEDGYCYGCRPEPNTTVTSLAVDDPASIAVVDTLAFNDENGGNGSWRRSISVTTDRMYVGGIDWGDGIGGSSTIQVVDISDPAGDLVLGGSVEVAGRIQSRWQMNEYEGVLRVISQPWDPTVFPRVQTFQVVSSDQLDPLGETQLTLPQPESLRAVRFDGTRAYAITAEVVVGDPLYTIDLSDPAQPQQLGELQMPGWVYHIEPRGDRLLALGFDEADPAGSLNVSLFDVSDMSNPILMERVAFGGDWSDFAEQQDQIHKAFKILPDLGLILVPFSAWDWDEYTCTRYQSGIQLVDWANDDLALRGVAPIRGEARRAFMHQDRLFAMSDEQLRTFDITDRDAPTRTAEMMLSTHVNQVLVHGDYVVRLAADWWTAEPRIEVVPADDPGRAEPLGALELGPMLAQAEQDESCYYWSYWSVQLFSHGDSVFLVWPAWIDNMARVVGIDLSDPAQPRLGAPLDVPVDRYSYRGHYWSYAPGLLASGQPVAQVGSTLVFLRVDMPVDEYGYPSAYPTRGTSHEASLRVVDLADIDAPRVAAQVPLPDGGGHTGLVSRGTQVLLTHWEPLGDSGRARFFLDRVDVAQPGAPVTLPVINVPGSLIAFDSPSANLLTVDYQRERRWNKTRQECTEIFGYGAEFLPDDPDWIQSSNWADVRGTCSMLHRSLQLAHVDEEGSVATLLDEHELPDQWRGSGLFVGDDRVFALTYPNYDSDSDQSEVWAIGGLRDGELEVRTEPIENDLYAYWWPLEAEGQRLVAMNWTGALVSVDASDLDDIVTRQHEVVPWSVYTAEIDGDRALVSLGAWGLYEISLTESADGR